MNKKNYLKAGSLLGLTLIIGYVIGSLIGEPFSSGALSGDVSKARKVKQEVTSDDIKVLEQRLKTDTEFREQTQFSLSFIASRVSEFQVNAEISADVASRINGFENETNSMKSLAKLAGNAEKNAGDALEAINLLFEDKHADFERFTNNALTSFLLLSNATDAAKKFVSSADAYLANTSNPKNSELEFARNLWVDYGIYESIFTDNEESLAYWGKLSKKPADGEVDKQLALLPDAQRSIIKAGAMNNALLLNNLQSLRQTVIANGDKLGVDFSFLGSTVDTDLPINNSFSNVPKLFLNQQESLSSLVSSCIASQLNF